MNHELDRDDLLTRLLIIEERQQRHARAMQYLAERVDRLTEENKELKQKK
jgi:hypothetical protein